jgi:hypothetical protein
MAGATTSRRKGEATLRLIVLDSIVVVGRRDEDMEGVEVKVGAVVLIRKVAQLRQLGDPLSR